MPKGKVLSSFYPEPAEGSKEEIKNMPTIVGIFFYIYVRCVLELSTDNVLQGGGVKGVNYIREALKHSTGSIGRMPKRVDSAWHAIK